ncbi:hypothetical protein KKC65_02220 [Patescibacteria group bacterium]|nr:hypothetical protein [Patescibacteria group bacterium]
MIDENLIKNTNIEKIAKDGSEIYQTIKTQYEPDNNGKFLAIDIESKEVFLGETSSEAVELARTSYPDKVFYVVKIGHSVVDILAHLKANV